MTYRNLLFYYLLVINIFTFLLFGFDKFLAIKQKRRIRERTLWLFSVLGGSLGGLLAMEVWRHKRQKIDFILVMVLILLIQAFVIYLIFKKMVNV